MSSLWSPGGRRFESVRGLFLFSCLTTVFRFPAGDGRRFRRPPSVHERPPLALGARGRAQTAGRGYAAQTRQRDDHLTATNKLALQLALWYSRARVKRKSTTSPMNPVG